MSSFRIRATGAALAGVAAGLWLGPAYPHSVCGARRTKITSAKLRTIAVALAATLIATSAFAHAELEKATPPVGGTVASANEIRLTFSEGVEPKFSKVSLTGPAGPVPLGAAKTESGNPAVLIVPIAKPLSAGAYKVRWQAVSVDTHHTQGTFEFTVKP
jgi:methionine-rich copper-binding protein CopC